MEIVRIFRRNGEERLRIIWKSGAFLLLIWLVFMLAYQGFIAKLQHDLKRNTRAFLQEIQSQNYTKAAELHRGSIDLASIRKLDEMDGFRLLSVDRVTAAYDDGCVCTGKAELTFAVKGEALQVSAIVTSGTDYMPGQICALTPPGIKRGSIPELSQWNLAACGSDSF